MSDEMSDLESVNASFSALKSVVHRQKYFYIYSYNIYIYIYIYIYKYMYMYIYVYYIYIYKQTTTLIKKVQKL